MISKAIFPEASSSYQVLETSKINTEHEESVTVTIPTIIKRNQTCGNDFGEHVSTKEKDVSDNMKTNNISFSNCTNITINIEKKD